MCHVSVSWCPRVTELLHPRAPRSRFPHPSAPMSRAPTTACGPRRAEPSTGSSVYPQRLRLTLGASQRGTGAAMGLPSIVAVIRGESNRFHLDREALRGSAGRPPAGAEPRCPTFPETVTDFEHLGSPETKCFLRPSAQTERRPASSVAVPAEAVLGSPTTSSSRIIIIIIGGAACQ